MAQYMDMHTVSRRTPDMDDIFPTGVQSSNARGVGTSTESEAAGRRTPDLDEIFESDIMGGGRQAQGSEGNADHRGMHRCQYSVILKF